MNKRKVGSFYEDMAADYLIKNGVKIIDKNFTTRHGEIDLIGKDGEYLVFFEIKYRSSSAFDSPFAAVSRSKQKHVIEASRYYLYKKHLSENIYIRFDCLGITDAGIEWIKNAYSL